MSDSYPATEALLMLIRSYFRFQGLASFNLIQATFPEYLPGHVT